MDRPLLTGISCQVEIYEDFWNFSAIWFERRVGFAWCIASDDELEISDLKVENEFIIPVVPILPQLCPARRNFRRKGIGSALLDLIIKAASERKMKRIHGTVSAHDLENFPQLMEWLEQFGFQKSLPRDDIAFKAAWSVHLVL